MRGQKIIDENLLMNTLLIGVGGKEGGWEGWHGGWGLIG